MNFDVYAELAVFRGGPIDGPLPAGLASGFVDRCTTVFHVAEVKRERGATQQQRREAEEEKNDARGRYIQRVPQRQLTLPHDLGLDADAGEPPDPSWVRFDIKFKVETPWYSKDDRLFHVLDNPVRKDRVFGVPFMSAASWKGLLRWACRMQASLGERPGEPGQKRDGRREPAWITHLFGNEKGEEEHFQQGALAFYATWFSRLGFEVINPHSRKTRAGTHPIYYEVVPAGTDGSLRLLYGPLPGAADRDKVKVGETIERLLVAIEALLTTYGISAKRTVGWGTAKIESWTAMRREVEPITAASLADLKVSITTWLNPSGDAA